MVKLVFLMRRNSALSPAEFRDYWLNVHSQLIRRHASALGIRRYVQSHAIGRDAPVSVANRFADGGEPWDGMAEVWIDSLDALDGTEDLETMAVQTVLMEDEQRFIDHKRSVLFITEEHEII